MEVRNDCAVEERNDEPPKEASDSVDEACEDATELRPRVSVSCYVLDGTMVRRHTAVHCLLEHSLDHLGTMPGQQGLDVAHRILWDVEILHGWRWRQCSSYRWSW